MNFKKPFILLLNLKRYISWNLISLIGLLDFLYCIYFYSVAIGPERFSAGDIMLIFSVYYSIVTRVIFGILFICYTVEKAKHFNIKQNYFTCNKIYVTLFFFGLIVFSLFSLIILISIIYIFVVILLFY